jgi:hypothetical protein
VDTSANLIPVFTAPLPANTHRLLAALGSRYADALPEE